MAAVVLVTLAVVVGVVLGVFADLLLVREALATGLAFPRGHVTDHTRSAAAAEAAAATSSSGSLVASLLVVRAVTLLPVAAAVAWGATRLVAAGYHQLILPDDLRLPLAVRILLEALGPAAVVVAVWLAAELVGGIAVREVLVAGRPAHSALGAAALDIVRRPLTSVGTYGLGVLAVVVPAGPTLLLSAILWSRLQALLADGQAVPVVVPATFVFVTTWVGGLGCVGLAATWRSILGTLDVLRTRQIDVAMGSPAAAARDLAMASAEAAPQEG